MSEGSDAGTQNGIAWLLEQGRLDAYNWTVRSDMVRVFGPKEAVYLTGYVRGLLQNLIERGVVLEHVRDLLTELSIRENEIRRYSGPGELIEANASDAEDLRSLLGKARANPLYGVHGIAGRRYAVLYLALFDWTAQAQRSALDEIGGGVLTVLERFMAFVTLFDIHPVAIYLASSEWDGAAIVEAPDAKAVKAAETALIASGRFKTIELVPLISLRQYEEAISAARELPRYDPLQEATE